jgi:hypothetical protein
LEQRPVNSLPMMTSNHDPPGLPSQVLIYRLEPLAIGL